jgi:hypothetical protein
MRVHEGDDAVAPVLLPLRYREIHDVPLSYLASGGLASHAIRRQSDGLRSASWPELGKILKQFRHAKRVMPDRGKAICICAVTPNGLRPALSNGKL